LYPIERRPIVATCGSCKQSGVDVAHVKACYGRAPEVQKPTPDYDPRFVAEYVPDSDYALQAPDGTYAFYRVRRPKKGKWQGFTFVDRLVGHPGGWATYPVKGASKTGVLQGLATDPKAHALAFSREHGVCACCGSPLSDPESIARGFGPICIERFAA
jgi:hypothetical protein